MNGNLVSSVRPKKQFVAADAPERRSALRKDAPTESESVRSAQRRAGIMSPVDAKFIAHAAVDLNMRTGLDGTPLSESGVVCLAIDSMVPSDLIKIFERDIGIAHQRSPARRGRNRRACPLRRPSSGGNISPRPLRSSSAISTSNSCGPALVAMVSSWRGPATSALVGADGRATVRTNAAKTAGFETRINSLGG